MPPKFKRDYAGSRAPESQALLDGCSDDDDFFLTGPNAQPGRMVGRDGKVSRLQNQVDEVVTVMKENVNKVIERGDRLDDLQDKSDHLTLSAESFRTKARSVRSQMWWKECKMRLLVAFVVIVILLIIIVPIIVQYTKKT